MSLDDLPKFKLVADPLKEAAYEQIVEFVELDAQLDESQLDESSPAVLPISPAVLPISTLSPGSSREIENHPPSGEMEGEEHHPELASLQQLQRTEDEVQELEAVGESWRNLQQDLQVPSQYILKGSYLFLNHILSREGFSQYEDFRT